MRTFISLCAIALIGLTFGCNSQEGAAGRAGNPSVARRSPQAVEQPPHATSQARRITAQDLHKLWQQNEVLIVDTRTEPAFRQNHIKGAILIPSNEFASRADELPKSKMIVTYCT
jgi:predicted sulfurtransferase